MRKRKPLTPEQREQARIAQAARRAAWTPEQLEHHRAVDRAYGAAHKKEAVSRAADWAAANPERVKTSRARRRAARTPEQIERDHIRENANAARWRAENPEKVKASSAKSGADPAQRERRRIRSALNYAAHREEILADKAAHRKAYPEEARAAGRRSAARHPEKRRIARAAYYASHREEEIAAAMEWAAANPEKVKAISKKHHAAHPLKARAIRARRRALKRNAPGKPYTAQEFRALCDESSWQCSYCARVLDIVTVEADHIVPLARGGSNGIENIAVSCRPCNISKNDRPLAVFLSRTGRTAFGPNLLSNIQD